MGVVEKIWIKSFKSGAMDSKPAAELRKNPGIINNTDQKGKRQVTIFEKEKWQAMMQTLKCGLDPSARRANLLVNSISLNNSNGKILNISECSVKVYGELKPCELMDEILPGLKEVMKFDWNGRIYGIVEQEGTIHTGDKIFFA